MKKDDIVIIVDKSKFIEKGKFDIQDNFKDKISEENSNPDVNHLYKVVDFIIGTDIPILKNLVEESDFRLGGRKKDDYYYLCRAEGLKLAATKVGMKVKIIYGLYKGNQAVVVDDSGDNPGILLRASQAVGVRFPKKAQGRHDCNGKCEEGHGWYYCIEDLEVIEREPLKGTEQVVVIEENEEDVVKEVESEEKNNVDNEEIRKLTKELSKLTREIHKKERFQDLMNEAVIEKGKEIAVEDLKEKLKSELDSFIEEKYGVLPKRIEIVTERNKKEVQGIFHKDFEKICRLVDANIPVMLTGGAGAGKNYTLEQVSEALDLDFYFSNAVNQEYKLTGFVDANGTYHETEFYKAFVRGGMFFLDEIDASSPECLVILNSAIANKYFDFPTGRVKAHENFRVVCAGNTYGTGADMVYVGRNVLDGATLDRFVVVPFDYDENVEKQLAYDMELYNFIYNLRKAVNECNLRYIVSMRALINASKMLELGLGKQEILKTAIIKNMQIDDLNTIYNKLPSSDWKDELDKFIKREEYV